jgi:outer membrane protein assembly factor BamB
LPARQTEWTGWRGPNRDGRVAWLPDKLPSTDAIVWKKRLGNRGLAGVAATADVVLVADRDPADRMDMLRCLSATDGSEKWTFRNLAEGQLDFGNSSRATPLVHDGLVYFASALGNLHALDLRTGEVRWKKNMQSEFGVKADLPWGFCASPLIADGKLIVIPGGPEASVVALKPGTGEVLWKTPGAPPGYGSPIVATLGGRRQIVAHDKDSLGGWDLATGERLWSVKPALKGDFNVPTPIVWQDKLIVATENNGTRIYRFAAAGKIDEKPMAHDDLLVPDTHTPIVVNDRLFGVQEGLHVLDLAQDLKSIATHDDRAFKEYVSLMASPTRVLATTLRGELVLFDATGDKFAPLARLQLFEDEEGLYSHPALVGTKLFVRGSRAIVCLELK